MLPPALLVPLGHAQTLGEPAGDVIVDGATLLQLCNPDVLTDDGVTETPFPIVVSGTTDVLRIPVMDAAIRQSHHDALPPKLGLKI